jgi:hypothetical protein
MDLTLDIPTLMLDTGVDATLGGVAVRGLFDADPVTAFGEVAGSNPIFILASSSVPPDPRPLALIVTGDPLNNGTYSVVDWNDDGHGLTTLQLGT